MSDAADLDLREQQARIRQIENDALLKAWETIRRYQDFKVAPLTLLATGLGAGAALFGAAIALLKWIG